MLTIVFVFLACVFNKLVTPLGLLATTANAFAPVPVTSFNTQLNAAASPKVDNVGNNILVKDLLSSVETSGLLTKVAQSGLLSKAQASGISLSKLEPLLKLASENKEVLILVESVTPEVLPLLPKLLELAPPALPLLASAVTISPGILQTLGLGALAAAGAGVAYIPDDSVVEVAAQTLLVGLMGAAAGASFVGSAVLGKIKA